MKIKTKLAFFAFNQQNDIHLILSNKWIIDSFSCLKDLQFISFQRVQTNTNQIIYNGDWVELDIYGANQT